MGKYFGTDGFRGEANVDLTVEHAYQVGRLDGIMEKIKKKNVKLLLERTHAVQAICLNIH